MKKVALAAFMAIAMCFNSTAQSTETTNKERVNIIHNNIFKYLYDAKTGLFYEDTNLEYSKKRHSYLWPLCALIQAADEMEKIEPGKKHVDVVLKAMESYYNPKAPAPAYQASVKNEDNEDRFYDDNQWIAIASMDAYKRTKNKRYLDVAKLIHRFQLTGYDNAAGGGLYWKEGDLTTKNTCSNGPAVLVALQLYSATKEKHYLDTAMLIYNWTNKHLQSPEAIFYDNIKIPSLKIDSAFYTYNAGTMLQANVLLYNINKNDRYLKEARRIAAASKAHFYKNGKLPGNYWFNAVLLRGVVELYKVDKDKTQLQYFIDDANRVWNTERNSDNLLGRKKHKALIDQAAMLEIYARLSEIR